MFPMGDKIEDLAGQSNNRTPCVSHLRSNTLKHLVLHDLVRRWRSAVLEGCNYWTHRVISSEPPEVKRQHCATLESNFAVRCTRAAESLYDALPRKADSLRFCKHHSTVRADIGSAANMPIS
ncbi:hypothetical protein TNCV_4672501 [Trichonephila clavipes]|nr:hypothetical protein TNCV_4672501 [Trichonephila clavipes]